MPSDPPAWRDFPRPAALSSPGREKLLLAALLERGLAACVVEPARADLRRALSGHRREALFDALRMTARLPACPPVEEAVRLEQLEADLTAALRRLPGTRAIRPALEFALLEEADQLYRFANLLDAEQDAPAERVTGGRIEITPGRPCVAAHRHPLDAAFAPLDFDAATDAAALSVALLAPLERQLAAHYAARSGELAGADARLLFAEMALIEEQHAAQYESLWDPRLTPADRLLLRQRALCYAYHSLAAGEDEPDLRALWSDSLARARGRLVRLRDTLRAFSGAALPDGFPPPFLFGDTSALVRALLPRQAGLTMLEDSLAPVGQLPSEWRFFAYQRALNGNGADAPSHRVVLRYAARYGTDYRFERGPNPIEALQNRRADNVELGRTLPAPADERPAVFRVT